MSRSSDIFLGRGRNALKTSLNNLDRGDRSRLLAERPSHMGHAGKGRPLSHHSYFRPLFFVIIGLELFISAAGAQSTEPLEADRPDFTESAIIVPHHSLQLEGGYTYTRAAEEKNHSIGELLFRYGVTNRLEGRLALNSFTIQQSPHGQSTGWEDFILSLQFQLWRKSASNGWKPDSSLILGTTLPTGVGENILQPFGKWCLAWEIPLGFSAGTNLNYWHRREERTSFGEWAGSLSISHPLTGKLDCYGEYYFFEPTKPEISNSQYLNGGIAYLISPSLRVDFRLGRGLNPIHPEYFAGAGFAKRW